MQAAVHLRLESIQHCWETSQSSCVLLSDPVVTLGSEARAFLKADLDDDEDELMERNGLVRALILGCQGALKRGPLGSYAMSNMSCHIVNVHAEGGLSYLESMPGALRAGAANAMALSREERELQEFLSRLLLMIGIFLLVCFCLF